ncbi:MAG: DUF169 domain-containing protein [Acidobacteria bacterium]|nr:DUF169 domain-containing protein [Acidobacteriota bacterium]
MDYASYAERLSGALSLKLPPIALAFTAELPADLPRFQGSVAAGCVFWEEAARQPILTVAPQHEMCSIGVYTHNLADPSPNYATELSTVLNVLGQLEYARKEDVEQIPVLPSRPSRILYSPLARCPVVPDVVMLFASSADGLIISEAIQQVEGGFPPAMGRPACAVVPQVVNSGRAALSLGCCGARAYLKVLADDVAMWALPGHKLGEYTARIVALSAANKTLTRFHQLRQEDVASGRQPTYQESMGRLQSA